MHDNSPKGLLKIDDKPIIERSLDALRSIGVDSIVVVIGYKAEAYREYFSSSGISVTLVENTAYAQTGSMHSLSLALPHATEDFFLLESDLVYERRALTELASTQAIDCILVSGRTAQGDEVHVLADEDQCLQELTKFPSSDQTPYGELVGISKISRSLGSAMATRFQKQTRFPSREDYEECLTALSRETPIKLKLVKDLIWGEIDDETHYRRVVETVLPLIARPD